MKKLYPSFVFLCIILLFGVMHCQAAQDTIKAGSFLIRMGVMPQTINNSLKPYGLVYDLVKNHKVPVKWVINTGKTKDGADFTHNGIDYRGGTFIVPFEFRTTTVNNVISSWQAQGVVVETSVSQMVLDVFKTFYFAPTWTMDKQNGLIATSYFANAGIPASAYGGDTANWKTPAQLNACDDIFVMPHADPVWSTHNNLYYWNRDYKGNIWAACHAVSELENMKDPANTIQLNFLSTAGLVNANQHKKDASPPYQYQQHGHAVMQFMGMLDGATNDGSERTYLPALGSAWRNTTGLGVYDTTNAKVPSVSAGPAAIVAYGRAYGDENRGYVMYEAGHDHNAVGTEAERVAAQRAFFNYSFFVATDRYMNFSPEINGLPEVITPNQAYQLSMAVPPGEDLGNYTIQWSATAGGTFSSTNSQSVTYTAPQGGGACIVTVTITDGCGREVFSSEGTYIASLLASSTATLSGSYQATALQVQLAWTDANSSATDHYEIQRSEAGAAFTTKALFFPDRQTIHGGFTYKDKYAVQGAVLYRLKIISTSKAVRYSNIVRIVNEDAAPQLVLLSNPARGSIVFKYQSPVARPVTAVLMDMNGKEVGKKIIPVQKGVSTIQMGTDGACPAGMYVLLVVATNNSCTQKVQLIK